MSPFWGKITVGGLPRGGGGIWNASRKQDKKRQLKAPQRFVDEPGKKLTRKGKVLIQRVESNLATKVY